MLSAAIRVLARSATIQLEEVATMSARSPTLTRGKGKEIDPQPETSPVQEERAQEQPSQKSRSNVGVFPQKETLSTRLDQVNERRGDTPARQRPKSALDRMIEASPRQNPPPAPGTHPANQGRGELHQKPSSIFAPAVKKQAQSQPKPSLSRKPAKAENLPFISFSSPAQSGTNAQPKSSAKTISVQQASSTVMVPESSTKPHAQSAASSATPEPISSVTTPKQPSTAASAQHTATTSQIESPTTSSHPSGIPDISVLDLPESTSPLGPANSDPVALDVEDDDTPVILRASKVPSSRLGRLFHYGSLAASMSFGAASETIRRSTGGDRSEGSVFMSDANIRRLVSTLGRMRGAALKLGQFMSIQDNHMLPPEIEKVLHQVQAHANYMPDWQMERVMREELGSDWQSLFSSFDRTPVASASIGQVHRATLAADSTPVAVKIQFPGVASSIESDLSNLSLLLRSSALLPKGLYLQNTIAVMRRELEDECDYVREAASGKRFEEFLKGDEFFVVPKVIEEGTTGKVLTTEWMSGKPLSRVKNLSQETRDRIGYNILRLCLQELFHFRFMQTDPNWANFLYSSSPDQIQLIDFGASREYSKEFMDGWYRLLKSALVGDREAMRVESLNLGYLTGEEEDVMLEAHLDSMALVASPFCHKGPYPFAKQTITDSVRALIPIMLKHRLTPPPQETYSLNRKLSGAFLMCAKLGANVDCQKLWEHEVGNYKEG
ncbi:hypothetical protein IAR55_004788 [Kwoniella newhampshirensis]|uniref:Protein kinase domain-containing protein n=1 Tax=Kwoniella newhampshirensis TaxID=1651941 RepID=A0AAW0YWQ5_9TREE